MMRILFVMSVLVFSVSAVFAQAPASRPATRPATRPASRPAKKMSLDLGNGVSMKFALIPAGTFQMGSPTGEKHRDRDEGPQHTVMLTKGFYMGVTEVTQAQWKAVMGTTPWSGKKYARDGANNAASYVSWNDAIAFCKKMATKTGKAVRLPTEAEWEYACRAGSKTAYYFGGDERKLSLYAWCKSDVWGKGEKYAHEVGRKLPNSWGLYDMHGNVWESCQDGFAENYPSTMQTDPKAAPAANRLCVLRSGSWWNHTGWSCRSAARNRVTPDVKLGSIGLRAVVSLPIGRN